ncbi:hypothetical protein Mpsy_2887 [Methanolobus psychrophilus R15]|nr:hypothetical protein Mpsy_2887 [Methanolobus psychrophilus R15]
MRNVQKCIKTYKCQKMDTEYRSIVNGQYEKCVDADELDLIRFMIGGIDSK